MLLKQNHRDLQFYFMSAVGIIFVLFGHLYQPPFLFYPAFAFHMALFFFISGYFSTASTSIRTKAKLLVKKTLRQLIPYFILNLLFGCITAILNRNGISLGGVVNWENLFVAPFGRGDQYNLFLAAWFLLVLYSVNVIAVLFYSGRKVFDICIAILSAGVMGYFIKFFNPPEVGPYASTYINFGIRVSIGFFFFSLGSLFRYFEPSLQKYLLHPSAIIILFLAVDQLLTRIGYLNYNILFNDLGQGDGKALAHIISTGCIILMIYFLAYYITQFISEKSIIYLIGRNTFSIMVWHLTMFWLVNVALYKLGLIEFSSLSEVYFAFEKEKTWPVYVFAGLFGSIGLAIVYRSARKKVLRFLRLNAEFALTKPG